MYKGIKLIASVILLLKQGYIGKIKLYKEIELVRSCQQITCYNVVWSVGPYFSIAGPVQSVLVRSVK